MKAVQELVAYFDVRGELSTRELKRILDKNHVASEVPPHMGDLSDVIGTRYYFRVTGMTEGVVWGTDTYTRDSVLGVAAVHAGLLKPGETAVLRLTVASALPAYEGTTRNGVTTSDYGSYPHCWQLSAL